MTLYASTSVCNSVPDFLKWFDEQSRRQQRRWVKSLALVGPRRYVQTGGKAPPGLSAILTHIGYHSAEWRSMTHKERTARLTLMGVYVKAVPRHSKPKKGRK